MRVDLIGEALSRRFALPDAYRYASLLVSTAALLGLAACVAALRREWRVTALLRRPFAPAGGDAPSAGRSGWREAGFVLGMAVLLAAGATVFATLRTTTEYRERPLGDAAYYSTMALFFREPEALQVAVPTLHGNRVLPSALASLIAGDTFEDAIARYEAAQGALNRNQLVSRWLGFEGDFDPGELDAAANAAQIELLIQLSRDLADTFRAINLVALSCTVTFLLLLLRHEGAGRRASALVAVLFVSLFVPVRLFVAWPQMIDPTALALTFGLVYSAVAHRRWLFVPLFAAALMTRESMLVFAAVLGLSELHARAGQPWLPRLMRATVVSALCVLPALLLFGWFRMHPVFLLQGNIEPPPPGSFIEMRNLINLGTDVSLEKYLRDSSFVSRYYWDLAWSIPGMTRTLLLTPANVMGVLFLYPLLRARESARLLHGYWYLTPLLLAAWFASPTIDRHFVVAAPVFCLLAGRLFEAERVSFSWGLAAVLFLVNGVLNRVFSGAFNPIFQQVEYLPGKWVIPSLLLLGAAVLALVVASRRLEPRAWRLSLGAALGLHMQQPPSGLADSRLAQ